MRAWIIIDGEKTGPFDIAQVARRIESGELTSEHHGWVEGMKDWLPLTKIPAFEEAFQTYQKSLVPPPIPEISSRSRFSPVPQGTLADANRLLMRRFCARWLDLMLWMMLIFCFMILANVDFMGLKMNLWFQFAIMIVWVLIEAAMIHVWGFTPGKALFGLRVYNVDGSKISLGRSLLRSMRVYLMGMGMQHPILMPLCHGFSWWFFRKYGATLWDGPAGFVISAGPISIWRSGFYALLLFVAMNMLTIAALKVSGKDPEQFSLEMMELWMPKEPVKP